MTDLKHSDVKNHTHHLAKGQLSKEKKIMIVEDDGELLDLYKKVLDLGEYKVITAQNGLEAIKLYKHMNQKPSIIIIDHRMPVKDGIETLIELRTLGYEKKVIYISADYKSKKDAMRKGANIFLEKPFSIQTLMAQIN